jgi:hypothetical protein
MKKLMWIIICLIFITNAKSEDGYRLWLRYDKVSDNQLLQDYRTALTKVRFIGNSAILDNARAELFTGLEGLLDQKITNVESGESVLVTRVPSSANLISPVTADNVRAMGTEGYMIRSTGTGATRKIIPYSQFRHRNIIWCISPFTASPDSPKYSGSIGHHLAENSATNIESLGQPEPHCGAWLRGDLYLGLA